MKIVVTTPTGQIGNKLANILLDRKSDVTLIARHPEKVKDLASRGAKVVPGEHSDSAVVEQAVRGAQALFWLTPSEITSHDPLGTARRMANTGASVISKHPDLHVVHFRVRGHSSRAAPGQLLDCTRRKRNSALRGKTSSRCVRTSSWRTCFSRYRRSSTRAASTRLSRDR
jgi:NAD(P)H-binding